MGITLLQYPRGHSVDFNKLTAIFGTATSNVRSATRDKQGRFEYDVFHSAPSVATSSQNLEPISYYALIICSYIPPVLVFPSLPSFRYLDGSSPHRLSICWKWISPSPSPLTSPCQTFLLDRQSCSPYNTLGEGSSSCFVDSGGYAVSLLRAFPRCVLGRWATL